MNRPPRSPAKKSANPNALPLDKSKGQKFKLKPNSTGPAHLASRTRGNGSARGK